MSDLASNPVHQTAINTLRFLAVDMVERAASGHPGAPMGLAPLAYLLWSRHLRHDPAAPDWPDRDRFVLSCGHASALLYGLLHLSGHGLSMEELRRFRQLGSKTPGHPEYGLTTGVETTTGPLGQGLANAVGMALAQAHLAARFNRPGFELFRHRTWVLASDGDLMEGVVAEATSFAGHHRLAGLKVFYDDNRITIDGGTDLTFSEDVGKRFEACGWRVLRVDDGNDLVALEAAIAAAEAETEKPTLVSVRTIIGFGSPNKQDSSAAHGSPLGADEALAARRTLGWPEEGELIVPPEALAAFRSAAERGADAHRAWRELRDRYDAAHPLEATELDARLAGELPSGWRDALPSFGPGDGKLATRKASGKALNAVAGVVTQLVGGSADLAGSNNTTLAGEAVMSAAEHGGRNLHFGVREHAMGSIMNGMALSGLLIPYGGTFLIFSDYMRPAIRLAALMKLQVIYVLTHDSIFLGEDGPTHQPISQLAALRAIPNLTVLRPADANETAAAWAVALEHRRGPVALGLTRHGWPILDRTREQAAEGVARGGYLLRDAAEPRLVLLATGSEVALATAAAEQLEAEGTPCRVVSLPSWELFEAQPAEYRRQLLPARVPRLAIEAGSPLGWHRWVGEDGDILAMDGFGESAPAADLATHFGFTVDEVLRRARALVGG